MSNKKNTAILSFIGLTLIAPSFIAVKNIIPVKAEGDINDHIVLRIKNMADYIYIDEEDRSNDLIHQFEQYCKDNTKYKNVEVVYQVTDTNETLLTELQTGKSDYDLICPSEYMIQKMINQGLLQQLNRPDRDTLLEDYDKYASKYIRNRLDSITYPDEKGNIVNLGQYTVGYMWGTLGLLFNPNYNDAYIKDSITDMDYFSILTDSKYKGTISIKDSIRDTYAVALMYGYENELKGYRERYLDEEEPLYDSEAYHNDIQKVFDRTGKKDDDIPGALDVVKKSLDSFKNNMYGLEVDTGKYDILQKKIGINMAWSGDACYSIEEGLDPEKPYNTTLYYAIPLNGSNIWFDGWVIPKCDRTDAQEELAYMFLNFISMPENAAQNMEYIGYTPFIAGDSDNTFILDLTRSWYDIRYNEEDGSFDDTIPFDEDEMQYVDLNYFFNSNFSTDPSFVADQNYVFFTDEYYIERPDEQYSQSVGGQFFCQFPDFETITRCAIMKDYGAQNEPILKLWESFKSNALPLWAIILFVIELVLILIAVTIFSSNKIIKKKIRKNRKK